MGVYCLALVPANTLPKTPLGGIHISQTKQHFLEGSLHPCNILMCPHTCVTNLPKPRQKQPGNVLFNISKLKFTTSDLGGCFFFLYCDLWLGQTWCFSCVSQEFWFLPLGTLLLSLLMRRRIAMPSELYKWDFITSLLICAKEQWESLNTKDSTENLCTFCSSTVRSSRPAPYHLH